MIRIVGVSVTAFLLTLFVSSGAHAAPPGFNPANTIVFNDEADPVRVREVDTPGRDTYQEDDTTNTQDIVGTGTLGLEMQRPVPEGKRLVVQHVSVSLNFEDPSLDMNCSVFGGSFNGQFGRVTPKHALLLGPQFDTQNFFDRIVGRNASQPITLYVDSGLTVEIGCVFSRELFTSDAIFMQGSVTGYLIDTE